MKKRVTALDRSEESVSEASSASAGPAAGRGSYVKIKSLGGVNMVKLNKL